MVKLAKTYLHVAFMDGSGTASTDGTSGLNIVQTDIDTNYSGATSDEGTPLVSDYGSQCAVLEAKSIDLYVPVYWGGGAELLEQGACQTPASHGSALFYTDQIRCLIHIQICSKPRHGNHCHLRNFLYFLGAGIGVCQSKCIRTALPLFRI